MNQTVERHEAEVLLNAPGQRWRHILHKLKAKWLRKEMERVKQLSVYIPSGATVLDVGAHFGYFAKEFARLYQGTCQVHCFEPVDYTRSVLKDVVGNVPNVKIYDVGLADIEGTQEIYIPIKASGWVGPGLAHMGQEKSRDYIAQSIALRKLDEIVAQEKLKRVDFIKCDVEGAELQVFRGGHETISRFRPVVFCEVHPSYTERMGYAPDELFGFFADMQYVAMKQKEPGHWQAVTSFEGADDYLFIPKPL